MKNRQIKIGVIGTFLTALCCFTPILVIALTGIGAAAAIGYLDMVLFPLLAAFIILTAYGVYRRGLFRRGIYSRKCGGEAADDARN